MGKTERKSITRSTSDEMGVGQENAHHSIHEVDAEFSVGIECYANSADGFRAILKERYTDFVVNEIDKAGKVVFLTCLAPTVDNEIEENERRQRQKFAASSKQTEPAVVAVAKEKEEAASISKLARKVEERSVAAAAAPLLFGGREVNGPETDGATVAVPAATRESDAKQGIALDESLFDEFTKLAGTAESERLKAFLALPGVLTPLPEGCKSPQPLILRSSNDKGYRTNIHNFFSMYLQLPTDTVNPPIGTEGSGPTKKDSKRPHMSIRVHPKKHPKGNNSGRGQKRGREEKNTESSNSWTGHQSWPSGLPSYLEFTLCKENKETADAIGILSRLLHLKPKAFGFAGTKDKRGVTSQRVTLHRVRASRLAKLKLHGMQVGNFRYSDRHLGLGDLKGNLFTLTMRGVEPGSKETVALAVKALTTSGFINYFGLQRFGTHTIPTHAIGAALLRGAWSEAIELILRPRAADKADVAAARAVYKETGDAAAALKLMPHWCVAERGLLEGLVKVRGNDFVGALSGIPRTTRKMYVHAYQVRSLCKALAHLSRDDVYLFYCLLSPT